MCGMVRLRACDASTRVMPDSPPPPASQAAWFEDEGLLGERERGMYEVRSRAHYIECMTKRRELRSCPNPRCELASVTVPQAPVAQPHQAFTVTEVAFSVTEVGLSADERSIFARAPLWYRAILRLRGHSPARAGFREISVGARV